MLKRRPQTRAGRRRAWAAAWRPIAIVLAIAFAAAPAAAQSGERPSIFGSAESAPNPDISLFPDWAGVIDRMNATPEPFEDACEFPQTNRCFLKKWNQFLAGLRNSDRASQLEAVNSYMNNFRYVANARWETPLEFYFMSGDCKDYAVAKYMSLRYLGFLPEEMRIVVVRDLNLRVDHAVLVVYINGEALVLDNQIHQIVNARNVHHYKPTYSINEQDYWLHRS